MDQRRCPGTKNKPCNKFMCSIDRDYHNLCVSCRGNDCNRDNPCDVCVLWDDNQWIYYLSRRKHRTSDILRPALSNMKFDSNFKEKSVRQPSGSSHSVPRSESSDSASRSGDRACSAPRSPPVSPGMEFSALARNKANKPSS